jgi:hypothetical protein
MSKLRILSLLVVALFALLPAVAQEDSPPTLARGYQMKVKMGHEAAFEAAVKKQIEWYEKNDESWTWHMWQWETGDKTGQYFFRSPGHAWKDMDERAERSARARSHFMGNAAEHLESMSASISSVLPHLSLWPESAGIPLMVSVHEFSLHSGKAKQFLHVLGKFHEAIQEAAWPVHYAWLSSVSGGEVPSFALVIPRANWADMADPDQRFEEMLEATLGRADADAVLADFFECIRSQRISLARLRPELSYTPQQ